MSNGTMRQDILEIILTEEEIAGRVKALAKSIEDDYAGKDLVMVCVLNGAAVFYIALMMEMTIPLEMNFIRVSSYGSGMSSSGTVRILYDLEKMCIRDSCWNMRQSCPTPKSAKTRLRSRRFWQSRSPWQKSRATP